MTTISANAMDGSDRMRIVAAAAYERHKPNVELADRGVLAAKRRNESRVIPETTHTFRAPILASGFGKIFVSIMRPIGSIAIGLGIIVLLASGCATPVGVTRLDEQA